MILDTNAVSALFAGDPRLGDLLAADALHHLPVIVMGEYRYGLLHSDRATGLEVLLDTLIRESIVLRVDPKTAESYARVRQGLRRAGTPIPENDIWIAALALQHGEPVVSRDPRFDHVTGIERIAW